MQLSAPKLALLPLAQPHPDAGLKFDWLVSLLSLWLIGGIHLDAWAHHQFAVETFFTPWHGVLYSGFLATALLLVGNFVGRWRSGRPVRQALAAGYELSLLGVALFLVGGVGDMLWHLLFGLENDLEALLSPTHLLLAVGGALIVTGPLRAAWLRGATQSSRALVPALLAAALLLSLFSFFTAYANPLSEAVLARGARPAVSPEANASQALGLAGILLQSGLMMGVLLLLVRRWALPFGSLTLISLVSVFLGVSVHEDFVLLPFAVLSGLVMDLLVWLLNPSSRQPGAFRLFAFLAPVMFYIFYFATLAFYASIWWTVHVWTGAIVLAGIVGWLLSYAYLPPFFYEQE